jgi:hypothetical protein
MKRGISKQIQVRGAKRQHPVAYFQFERNATTAASEPFRKAVLLTKASICP